MYETLITLFNTPVYWGGQMAMDADVDAAAFQRLWDATELPRTLGKLTLEEALRSVLAQLHCDSKEVLNLLVQKRVAAKEACFAHMHEEILPLLDRLRARGMRVGLISNCFSEEACAIRGSVLFPYFDAVCLSCEQGVQKPDPAIFQICVEKLGVRPDECLYVGDGGSRELEAARALGMQTAQAAWYLKEGAPQPTGRLQGFRQLETPLDVFRLL